MKGDQVLLKAPKGGVGGLTGIADRVLLEQERKRKKRGSQETNKEEKRRIDLDLF